VNKNDPSVPLVILGQGDYEKRIMAPRVSRASDPESSRQAEREITESGARATYAELIYRVLHDASEPMTCGEIAAELGVHRSIISKRLPDLREWGEIVNGPERLCRISDRSQITWRIER